MAQQQDIVQFNCNGVKSNYHHILEIVKEFNPKFILLQELRIIKSEELKVKGYTLLLKTTGSRQQPSVGILVADGILYDIIDTPNEILVIGINTYCSGPISLFSFYDNPRINKLSENNLKIIANSGKYKPIIMGDFNAKSSIWDSNRRNNNYNDQRAKSIINFLNNSNCIILNDGSETRISPIFNYKNSALDLTIVDKSFFGKFEWKVVECCYGSDHLPTMISTQNNYEVTVNEIWDYQNTDWDCFNRTCELSDIFNDNGVDVEDVNILDIRLTEQILNGLKASTPLIRINPNKRKKPPWWDEDLQVMKREKIKMLKKYTRIQSKENLTNLKRINAKYRLAIGIKKKNSWEKFISDVEDLESKDMWNRLNVINGKAVHKAIKNLEDGNGGVIEDRFIMANRLGSFYQSISSVESLDEQENLNKTYLRNSLESTFDNDFQEFDQDFTKHELVTAIKNTKNTAPGPDGFKYIIFKKLSNLNLLSLLRYYNIIWCTGVRPDSWNVSKVIPIPKTGRVKQPKDTRPINLINNKAKLYDKMTNARLIYILEENKMLDSKQFGFRRNKQTLSSMLQLNKDILDAFENRSHVQLISFDIYKAFDRVWPETILKTFQRYKIGGRIYKYIASFLKKRIFKVSIGMTSSDEFHTELGVPQGSPLSSTLFLMAFQGILDELKTVKQVKYSAYADDLIIYADNNGNLVNKSILQIAIDKITKKGQETGLKFSYEKTHAIHFCRKRNCLSETNTLEGQIINEVQSVKILGIVLQKRYRFKLHIDQLKVKLVKDLKLIKILSSVRYGLTQDLLKKIVIAISISKIRYGAELYGNTSKTNLKIINTMLNHFNRRISLAFVTSPIASLNIITGIPTIDQIIEKSNLCTAARMRANSGIEYPVYPTNNYHFNVHQQFNVSSALDGSTLLEVLVNKTIISPISSFSHQTCMNIFGNKKDDLSPRDLRKIFRDFIERSEFRGIVYTDGSKRTLSSSYALTTATDVIVSKKLHSSTSVFTAEALGILRAIKYLNQEFPESKNAIITDSQSVVTAVHEKSMKENEVIKQIMSTLNKNTLIVWVPGHVGIIGNELADKFANEAHDQDDDDVKNIVTFQDLQISMKRYLYVKSQASWNSLVDNKLQIIHPSFKVKNSNMQLNRKQTMIINRLRIGHCFLTHKYKIEKSPQPLCEWCDSLLTVEHIFNCNSQHIKDLLNKYQLMAYPQDIFDDSKLDDVFRYLKAINYFQLI